MNINKCVKESFVVIGKEGSTHQGTGFIQKLWQDANSNFDEVRHIAKKGADGTLVGIWGAMSDFSLSFNRWQNNFSEGLYLAGVECENNAEAPKNWVKWTIPGYEYIYVELETEKTFSEVINYIRENKLSLVGAVHDYTCPKTGKNYNFFPIKRL